MAIAGTSDANVTANIFMQAILEAFLK